MQSRFILMQGATVLLALFLMTGALVLSVLIRSQFASGVETLHTQIALQVRIHDAFDATVLAFWRTDGSPDPRLLRAYLASSAELRALTQEDRQAATRESDRQEAERLSEVENSFLAQTDHMVSEPVEDQENEAEENEVPKRELAVQNAFRARAETQFENLRQATAHVALYTRVLRILLLVLGLFPVVAMVWFRHAHRIHIWRPLDRLHEMVLEVRSGNLDLVGTAPDTVELGSVTKAFLAMASELREMRDSLEEKVRQRALELEAAHDDLLRAAKLASLGQLVSGVAHEINNPLTSILGFSEIILAKGSLGEGVRAQVRTIREEAVRLKHLVAGLSQFARRTPQQAHRLDLRSVPDRLLELRAYQLAANNIRVDYRRPQSPLWIKGDRDALLQLMLQLVLNAEHAIRDQREAGEIRLACAAEEGYAILTVEDNGCGVPPQMRERIFDPFFTTRPARQGSGLGLSMCHGIVEQHGGEVAVESEVGKGTKFRIRLPLMPAEAGMLPEAPGGDPRPSEPASTPSPSRRFLVIDDEAEILKLVSAALGRAGTTVVTLQDSTRLAPILKENSFDAVLCDLKMPGHDGLSVLRALRRERSALANRFVLMTGNLADADKAALELEGVPILPKPFSLTRLRQMLDQVTEASRSSGLD